MLKKISLLILMLSANFMFAQDHGTHQEKTHEVEAINSSDSHAKEEAYDPIPVIMHHISDAHEWHFWGEGKNSVTLHLPVILWEDGLKIFSSSNFHHGHDVAQSGGKEYMVFHNKVYSVGTTIPIGKEEKIKVINKAGEEVDSSYIKNIANIPTKEFLHDYVVGHKELEGGAFVTATKPLDISITKNVAGMLFAMVILVLLFVRMAKKYKTNGGIPTKFAGWMEPIIILVRDDIAKENIGEKKYRKFVPFLLSIFFFIWILNLMGLVPGFANVTGNIAFTLVLAVFTLIVVNLNGNKNYWKHIFWPPVPHWLKPMMIPVELIGVITKPFALMIRLFANMAAGHIVILSLVSLIFIAGTVAVAPGAIALVLFISVLELLVAVLQAYIFTLLTALFIGMAVDESHH